MKPRTRTILPAGFLLLVLFAACTGTAGAFHINTVNEGLLSENGCYIGAYLGGNCGVDGPNTYKSHDRGDTYGPYPYETQILDPGITWGDVNTGIDTFRAAAGSKHLIFSRYVNLAVAPYDNDYGKITFRRSPKIADWAAGVIRKNGVPMIVVSPWGFVQDQSGKILDLSVCDPMTAPEFGTGKEVLATLAKQLDAVSKGDGTGKPHTILIVFGMEFESHKESNPTSTSNQNGPNQKAYRRMFREAYGIVHANANPSVQLVWAGNTCDDPAAKKWWWPGYDDNMNQMSGGDYTDWVGQTRYAWDGGPAFATMRPFYQFYAEQKNHPYILTETGADGKGDTQKARTLGLSWIPQLYNPSVLKAQFPYLKGIVWFDVVKQEDGKLKNFLIPDGGWVDNGKETPGQVRSASDTTKMMKGDYPNAVKDSYFLAPA